MAPAFVASGARGVSGNIMEGIRVSQVDLRSLSKQTGCTENELLRGIRGSAWTAAEGAIAAPAEQITFLTDDDASKDVDAKPSDGINVALVSLAARPGVLDSERPKCLLPIGDLPLIGHVLNQLHAGGISRFVIVLGARGVSIRAAILALPVARMASIEFVDLGARYAMGFARSLLAASALLGGLESFLLCTPDHIFDASLVSELRTTPSQAPLDAIALVEDNVRSVSGALPPTAVHVALEDLGPAGSWPAKLITDIGKHIPLAGGIEAGLYRCNGRFFAKLAALAASQPYFTVVQAMQLFAADRKMDSKAFKKARPLAAPTGAPERTPTPTRRLPHG